MALETKGLEGVVANESALSDVQGADGKLFYRGYSIDQLVENCSYEEVLHLLHRGELPNQAELDALTETLRAQRELPEGVIKYVTEITVTRKNFPGTFKASLIVFWFTIIMTVCGIFVPVSIQALCFYISAVATIALGLKVF